MNRRSSRLARCAFARRAPWLLAALLSLCSANSASSRPFDTLLPPAFSAGNAAEGGLIAYDRQGIGHGESGIVGGGGAGNLQGAFAGTNINDLVGADRFYNAGYTGGGTVIANVEAGHIWSGHESLTHVVQAANHASSLNELDRHATWVGMVLGGRNGGQNPGDYQLGMAPDAELVSSALAAQWSGNRYALNFNFFYSTVFDQYRRAFDTGVLPGGRAADVINSSWGTTSDPSAVGVEAISTDALALANPTALFVASAGNDGAGPNRVESPAAAFNNLSVAALGANPAYDTPTGFSSGGPNNYEDPLGGEFNARQTVDIAAPGIQLGAAYYGGTSGGNGTTDNPAIGGSGPTGAANGPAGGADFYTRSLAGTSFSAPTVAGGAALLYDAAYDQFANNAAARDSRVIKAVLMNSADKTNGWNNGQAAHANALGGVTTSQGLDNRTGTGRMNLDTAFDQFLSGTTDVLGTDQGSQGAVEELGWDFGLVELGTLNDYYFEQPLEGGTTFTATLTWFRHRRIDEANSLFDESYNDMDLELWQVAGGLPTNVLSESISPYNNTEHFSFIVPATGDYTLRVRFWGEVFDVAGHANEEYYGLAWSGTVVPEPSGILLGLLGLGGLVFVGRTFGPSRRG